MHIHLDLMGGLAGDMFLAAAIDADIVDLDRLVAGLRTLGLGDQITIEHEKAWRGAMSATHAKFANWDPAADSDHRHLSTILEMIASSGFEPAVKETASELFKLLGASEAKVHGIPIETVHFHEVGAVDSILDFLSAAFIIQGLEGATWSIGDVPTGHGTIDTAHGQIPLPAPATADLLRGFQLVQIDVAAEMVTPTGAAILKMVDPKPADVSGSLRSIGYGAGTRDLEGISNVVRLMVLDDQPSAALGRDSVVRLSCDIDDMSPELVAYVETKLMEDGANDVCRVPVLMKKGRSGVRIDVLVQPNDADRFAEFLLRETTTFGVRREEVSRYVLARTESEVKTTFGTIATKIGTIGDEIIKVVPEFESCRAAAEEHGVPIVDVWREAIRATEEA